MKQLKFPNLEPDQIECRIGTCDEKGVSLLLYKDARVDMSLLDEVVGPYNWKREHCRDNANCIVSIWDDDKKEWISKEDVGVESKTQEQKGLASDSFKRSCTNWGIGRSLYSSPYIYFNSDECNINTYNGKKTCRDKFIVRKIQYDSKNRITSVTIYNTKTKISKVFKNYYTTSQDNAAESQTKEEPQVNNKTKEEPQVKQKLVSATEAKALANVCKKKDINIEKLFKQYSVESFEQFTKEQYTDLIKRIKNFEENNDKSKS